MDMKKILLFGGLLIVGLIVIGTTTAHADVDVYDTATLRYQNLVGIQQPDTRSNQVLCTLRGPILGIAKWQKVRRYDLAYTQALRYVVSNDSVTYKLIVANSGADTAKDVVITDTQSFVEAGLGGNTLSFTLGPGGALDDYDTPDLSGTIQNGYGTVANLQFLNSSDSWVSDVAFASWPDTEGGVRGIRWKIDYIAPQSVAGNVELYFTVKFK